MRTDLFCDSKLSGLQNTAVSDMDRIVDPAPPKQAEIIRFCADLHRTLNHSQAEGLGRYLQMLLKWNRRINLVGPGDWRTTLADLVADSWHLADHLRTLPLPAVPRTVDLGAGAGLPGVPLRLFWPAGDFHLVEIRQKRSAFLFQVVSALGLRQTFVRPEPAEYALPGLAPVDLCLSRAFMPWQGLANLVQPWLSTSGLLVVMANAPPPTELPSPWRLYNARAYPASGKNRYFWTLAEASISK